ncbi:hypothetical protein HYQ46_010154 [Verticillium longisporum]|nr:hypothetical protein HYQ46_010154 [Verticillium longisporum]
MIGRTRPVSHDVVVLVGIHVVVVSGPVEENAWQGFNVGRIWPDQASIVEAEHQFRDKCRLAKRLVIVAWADLCRLTHERQGTVQLLGVFLGTDALVVELVDGVLRFADELGGLGELGETQVSVEVLRHGSVLEVCPRAGRRALSD